MDNEYDKKNIISHTFGVYHYQVMSFDLKNVWSTYMKAMTTIFNDINYNEIEVYVDDGITKFCQISDQLKRLKVLWQGTYVWY